MCFGKVTTKWRNASSIILASSSTRRILMLKRGETASFMPNSLVFPGGVVDQNDSKIGEEFRVAAIRELFEESGVLLTKNGGYESSIENSELQKLKKEVAADGRKFELLKHEICKKNLIEWTTFLTPATNPKRFFTKFFLAVLKDEPKVDLCTSEMSEYCWVDPKSCVDEAFAGKFTLPPPQVYELTRLAQIKNWEECQNYANTSTVICPQPIKTIGTDVITNTFPGDHLYIENDTFFQPLRTFAEDVTRVDVNLPTHRVVYNRQPIYSKIKLYRHKLPPKYDGVFKNFETNSTDLLKNSK